MILVYILISGCIILAVGIGVGFILRVKRTNRENMEMENILKKYGKAKANIIRNPRDGGDLPHRL